MRKRLSLFFILFLALGVSAASASPVLEFGIDMNGDGVFENNFNITPGGSQTIDLYAMVTDDGSGVDTLLNPILIQGFELNLMYDATLLDVTAASIAAQFDDPIFGSSVDFSSDGSVVLFGANFPTGVGSAALVGSITFLCQGVGLSDLTMYDARPQIAGAVQLAAPNQLVSLDNQLAGGLQIGSVNQVPLPGAIFLLGPGLLTLFGLSWKRKGEK